MANPIRLDAIAESHRSRLVSEGPKAAALDDRTWADLNLDEVFSAFDRTESTLGQHAFYYRLRTSPAAPDLSAFEALVGRFGADAALRTRAQKALSRLRDPHGYDLWWLARPDAVETRPWYSIFPLLAGTAIVLFALAPFWPKVVPALIAILIVNAAVRYATSGRTAVVAGAFRQIAPVIATAEKLRFLGGDTNPLLGPLASDVPRLRRLKTIARWISGDPLMLPIQPHSPAVLFNDIVHVLYEYVNLAFLLDANGVYFGAGALRSHGAALLRVAAATGDVDTAISVATLRAERSDWTRPRFQSQAAPAVMVDVRHPLILDAVPNTLTLDPGRGVLVTGSNMSGKSTFLRTVGVNVVLAQTMNTCFAANYNAPVLAVRSCIGRTDDLLSGKSYYVAEVESLLGLVSASTAAAPRLFLLDELFRGTNAVERVAAGQAVLRQLVDAAGRANPHLVIAATHDAELVDLLSETYAPHHFSDAVGPQGLVFDHRLRPGPATTRNAIALLRLHGAPSQLIDRALACAEMLDRQRYLSARIHK